MKDVEKLPAIFVKTATQFALKKKDLNGTVALSNCIPKKRSIIFFIMI